MAEERLQFERYLMELIIEKKFSIKETGLNYREISYWSQKGLIDHVRDNQGKWHTFSFIELIEIKIYAELRKVGFSLNKLLKVKQKLLSRYPFTLAKSSIRQSPFIPSLINTLNGANMFIVIDNEAKYISFLHEIQLIQSIVSIETKEAKSEIPSNTIIIVSLRKLIKSTNEYFSEKDVLLKTFINDLLADEKQNIAINSRGLGKIEKVETTKYLKDLKNINLRKLLDSTPNQKITIATNAEGNISNITVNKRIK